MKPCSDIWSCVVCRRNTKNACTSNVQSNTIVNKIGEITYLCTSFRCWCGLPSPSNVNSITGTWSILLHLAKTCLRCGFRDFCRTNVAGTNKFCHAYKNPLLDIFWKLVLKVFPGSLFAPQRRWFLPKFSLPCYRLSNFWKHIWNSQDKTTHT